MRAIREFESRDRAGRLMYPGKWIVTWVKTPHMPWMCAGMAWCRTQPLKPDQRPDNESAGHPADDYQVLLAHQLRSVVTLLYQFPVSQRHDMVPAGVEVLTRALSINFPLGGGRGFLPGWMRAPMRLQPFIGGVMLVPIFGLTVWVALQYVPIHWH
jgi:hypothetical protein